MSETSSRITWQPQPKQKLALQCPIYEMFFGGAKGGGKSDFLLMDYAQNVGKGYGRAWKGVIFRQTYSELEELMFRADELYPALGGEFKEQKRWWIFPDRETLKMRYLDKDKDVHRYQGHQYSWIGFDELTNWATSYCYLYMHGCARSAAAIPVCVRASGNPGSKGHLWVKNRFIDNAPPMHVYLDPQTGLKRVFIPARLEDNLILQKNDPMYRKRLLMQPEHLQRAYLYGDWDIFAGQVFAEYRREKHVIRPVKIEPSWYRFASLDWGFKKPFSIGWWAVDNDGRKIRYREWYGCEKFKVNVGIEKQASEVAREAWEMSYPEGCTDMVADPSIWAKRGEGDRGDPQSIAERFEMAGWNLEKGINDRIQGVNEIHDLLKSEGHDGLPMMLIVDTCYDWIRTVPSLVASEKHPEDVDTDGEDHAYDETRYAVLSSFAHKRSRQPKTRVTDYRPNKGTRREWDALTWRG